MSNKIRKYTEQFRIRSYEVDMTNKATLQALCQYFQEAASNHAEEMGFGMSRLLEGRKTWMLSRLKVEMSAYPRAGEDVLIRTWPSGTDRLLILRDFLLETPGGEVLGRAVSSWVYMDLQARRPVHPRSPELAPFTGEGCERVLPENPGKVAPLEAFREGEPFRVRYNDLDMNNHVNNIKYIEWLLESLDPEFRRTHVPAGLEINFLAEALYGQEVRAALEEREGVFGHGVRQDGKDICRAETRWRAL